MKLNRRLFRSMVSVAVVAVLLSFAVFLVITYSQYRRAQISELFSDLRLLASFSGDYSFLDFRDKRFTVISPDGTVVFDSSVKEGLENHASRPEVAGALAYGSAYEVRRSSTVLEDMIYAAVSKDGVVLRLSKAASSVYSYILGMLTPLVLLLCAVVLFSALLSFRLSNRICSPINALDLDHPADSEGLYDELAPLARRIERQNGEISGHLKALERDRKEFELIMAGMNDGLMIVRRGGAIISINAAAKRLLGFDECQEFTSILELGRYPGFFTILEGGCVETKINASGRVLEIRSAIVEEIGSAVFIFDVSEKDALDAKEREFVQNVSHELRTPLTSISGYSELIASGNVDAEHVREFSSLINREAIRLARLIDDIMDLSKFDEKEDLDLVPVSLESIAGDVVSAFPGKNVSLKVSSPRMVFGRSDLIYEAVYNLVDNSLKYNRDGNPVLVEVEGSDVIVSDKGIGLSAKDRDRVFDRFYRVDKSRSRDTGGTGLGLSIVKRIADLHGAKITISSILGEGTTIRIAFRP